MRDPGEEFEGKKKAAMKDGSFIAAGTAFTNREKLIGNDWSGCCR